MSVEGEPRKMGATFYPGGQDDFYMPEIVAPAPQRITPEVPRNMQDELAALELGAANKSDRARSLSQQSNASSTFSQQPILASKPPANGGYAANYENTNASAYQTAASVPKSPYGHGFSQSLDSPSFSPFPKLRNPGPNVPPSDDEKERVLEEARTMVLNSNNPEMQLAWAQDALAWVEVSMQNQARINEGQVPRAVTPTVEHQLRVDALNIVSFLAEQHHPKADFMRGMWLEFGKFGYRIDRKEAFLCYRRAAEKGYARAEYRIGMQYESTDDQAKALKHYRQGVALHDSASNYRLGMMTLLGQHGQQQDYRRGIELIRFSADSADENAPQGAYIYGMLLARLLPNITVPETSLPIDTKAAKQFIEKAAYLGFAKAQLKMGQAYELCQLDCDFDPALSIHYNALASRQGEPEADMAISKWFLCGIEGVFEKNEELAFTYAQRAAQSQSPTAEFAMGYFYEIGMYVPTNLSQAQTWYEKAAEHGNGDAKARIESIRQSKVLSRKDHSAAISRIKSTHGSQRGGRPPRLQERPPPLPSILDERVDMPDPNTMRKTPAGYLSPPASASLVRPPSVAPYPVEDGPPNFTKAPLSPYYNPNVRPSSDSRPSSAFTPKPLSSSITMPALNPGSAYPTLGRPSSSSSSMTVPPANGRPSTSTGSMPPSTGGRGSAPASQGGPQIRVPSTGWEPQHPPSRMQPSPQPSLPRLEPPRLDHPQQQQQRRPTPNMPAQNINKPQPTTPQPTIDIGFTAPPDQRRPKPPPAGETPRVSTRVYDRPSDPRRVTPGRQAGGTSPGPGLPPNPQGRVPVPVSSSQSANAQVGQPASATPTQSSASSMPPKPSTGPKTFEEMGVPTGKGESDCVSRFFGAYVRGWRMVC